MATHSSTLAWKIPWTEKPGRLQSMGSLRVGHDWATSLSLFTFMHGEGNGNPLQCSYLKNPRDGGAWWAAVYGVAQSRTRLKRLNSSSSSSSRLSQGQIQASPVAQVVKNPPAMQETQEMQVFDLGVRKFRWRRKWQPTPVFLPGKFHGQRHLVGHSPWGRKESDKTEHTHADMQDKFCPV